jgi:hypothetical protein
MRGRKNAQNTQNKIKKDRFSIVAFGNSSGIATKRHKTHNESSKGANQSQFCWLHQAHFHPFPFCVSCASSWLRSYGFCAFSWPSGLKKRSRKNAQNTQNKIKKDRFSIVAFVPFRGQFSDFHLNL